MNKYSKLTILFFVSIFLATMLSGQKSSVEIKHLNKIIKKSLKITTPVIEPLTNKEYTKQNSHLNGRVYIISQDSITKGYAYAGRVYSCRSGGCSAEPVMQETDSYEYFDYIILFNHSILIESVKVYSYQATHGHEICSPGWLKQFRGYSGREELSYGNNIDAISGATISAISIIVDIENVAKEISLILEDNTLGSLNQ